MELDESINVFGEALVGCGGDPITVYFSENKRKTHPPDVGWPSF